MHEGARQESARGSGAFRVGRRRMSEERTDEEGRIERIQKDKIYHLSPFPRDCPLFLLISLLLPIRFQRNLHRELD